MNNKVILTSIGKDVSGCTTYDEVVEYANLDYKLELKNLVVEGTKTRIPNMKVIVKSDTGEVINTCKSRYNLLSNEKAFKITNDLTNDNRFKWLRAFDDNKYNCYFIGKLTKKFVLNDCPIELDNNYIEFYILFINSFNTKTPLTIKILPVKESVILNLPESVDYKGLHTNDSPLSYSADELYEGIVNTCNEVIKLYNTFINEELNKLQLYDIVTNMYLGASINSYIKSYNNRNLDSELYNKKSLSNYEGLYLNDDANVLSIANCRSKMLSTIKDVINKSMDSSTGELTNIFNLYVAVCKNLDSQYLYPSDYVQFIKEINNKNKVELLIKLQDEISK